MTPSRVHIIGAGLAGLSAGVELASRGIAVALYEGTNQAGGRCRSYLDATLGMEIDNGNHLVLSGNHATLAYLDRIGARNGLTVAPTASFPFVDLKTGECWTVRANDGPIPWWIFVVSRRVPGVQTRDYLDVVRLLNPRAGAAIGATIAPSGALYERLLEPFLLAALNIDPREGSAALAAGVIRETLAAGGRNYHPMIARNGLSQTFVAPAVSYVLQNGGSVTFGRRLRGFAFGAGQVTALEFAHGTVPVPDDEAVILAGPPQLAQEIIPSLSVPTAFRAIVNAHYRTDYPDDAQPMTGVINGLAQWVFAFPGRLSVTISAADDLMDVPREDLAQRIWQEVAEITGMTGHTPPPMPPWQIVRERRATFAASPEQDARRPGAATLWRNLALAGDWTQTGLPATIEGAIRSGLTAQRTVAPI